MQDPNFNQILRPSGLNDKFLGEGLLFEEYINLMRTIIFKSRQDSLGEEGGKIVIANSPFSWPSTIQHAKKGILLIHGLFDSPYYLHDLGEYFLTKDFLVRSILLPGHGTVPGDLLRVDYEEWLKAVKYGLDSFKGVAEDIFIAGYSLGGILALHEAIKNSDLNIKGLLLFAPAIEPRNRFKNLLVTRYKLFSWLSPRFKWYQIKKINNYAKYGCYTFNAALQACQLIKQVEHLLRQTPLKIPLLVIISEDDEIVSEKAILTFFLNQPHPKNRLLLYTNKQPAIKDNRISVRSSYFPNNKIINFSHICMTISPNNPLLGVKSNFVDLSHYSTLSTINQSELYRGSATRDNLKSYKISRLSFNPDFYHMLEVIHHFLISVEEA